LRLVLVLAVAAAVWLPSSTARIAAQTRATATNVPVIPHDAVPNFFKNPPGIYTGENMGIATNSKGNIYIYHRANETRLFEYTPQGVFVREIGRGRYGHVGEVQSGRRDPADDRPARGSCGVAVKHGWRRPLSRPQ
jgi:hypothetical protein